MISVPTEKGKTMREKLIKLLETVVSPNELLCDGEVRVSTSRVADHLIANGVTVQEWISVKDRLPEDDQVVLCYKAERGVRIGKHLAATYADGVSAFKDCGRDYAFGATHWMPLPEPPKGE